VFVSRQCLSLWIVTNQARINKMKDIRKGDFVRITYAKQWPGQFEQNTADTIDWGFIVSDIVNRGDPPELVEYILKSHSPFTLVMKISQVWLEKILVELYPKRTFKLAEGNVDMALRNDVIWKVKSDRDEVVILVVNPRTEWDEEGCQPVWDKLLKEDGSDLSEAEEDEYSSDLRSSLRELLSN
jgi:hypothetical protein